MSKLRRFTSEGRRGGEGWSHWCPGCKTAHPIAVEAPLYNGARWSFDGNHELPTFTPSMNIRTGPYPSAPGIPGRIDVCHYFITAGFIRYLSDTTHELSGTDVPLPDFPEGR